jgi:hypothetical protein
MHRDRISRRRPRPATAPVRPDAASGPTASPVGNGELLSALSTPAPGPAGLLLRARAGLRAVGVDPAPPSNQEALRSTERAPDVALTGGQPLPSELRARMERAFGGHAFDHVRVHVDGEAAARAAELRAAAFALGSHVFFAASAWSPGTAAGERLLAHELTHVVQHDEGRLPQDGGVSSPSDPAEREAYANEDAVLRELADVDWGLDAVAAPRAPEAPAAATAHRHPERDDEDWTPAQRVPPEQRYTLHGSTRRFAALMHVHQSGDYGEGGLGPDTVVTENGMTLDQLYVAWREGRLSATNGEFDATGAAGLVESLRQHGFVDSVDRARELGLPLDEGGTDGPAFRPLRVLDPGAMPVDATIDEALSGDGGRADRGLRRFVQGGGGATGTREERRQQTRDRRFRDARLEQLEERPDGTWAHRDGTELSPEEVQQLRQDLGDRAEASGLLRGDALARYRAHLADEDQPPLSGRRWSDRRRARPYADPTSPGDLADERGRAHVLVGDETGGGHAPGLEVQGKSEFPAGWTDEQIIRAASDIVTDPTSTPGANNSSKELASNGRPIRNTFLGVRDGVEILVVYELHRDRIVSAYPVRISDPDQPLLPDGSPNLIPAPRNPVPPHPLRGTECPTAEDLREQIQRRRAELSVGDPTHPGRSEADRTRAATRLADLERQLDEVGEDPAQRRRIAQAVRSERLRAGRQAGVSVHPTIAVAGSPAAPPEPPPVGALREGEVPSAEGLRDQIRRRQADLDAGDPRHPGRSETERALEGVRLTELERQLDASDDPASVARIARSLQRERLRAAEESGVVASPTVPVGDAPTPRRPTVPDAGPEGDDEEPVDLPTRSPLRGGAEDEAPDGPADIGNRSVTVRRGSGDGGSTSGEGSADRTGGGLAVERQGADGRRRSVRAEAHLEHRGDDVVGGDGTLGAGAGDYHGSLTAGGHYWADAPRRHGDRIVVAWELQLRGGGGVGGRLLRAGASLSASGHVLRSGTEVFPVGGDAAAAQARAVAFQREIGTWDEDRLERELGLLEAQSLGGYDWWTSDAAPVGTARAVEIGGEIGGSISARVVSVGGQVRTTGRSSLRKVGPTSFEAEVLYVWDRELNAGADFMVGNTGGFGLFDNARYEREAHVYRVELPAGERALRRHLAREAVMNEAMAGVTLVREVTEAGDLETNHTNLLVAGIDSRSGVTREVERDAEGRERVLHRAIVEGSGSAVDGSYFRHGLRFEAPEGSDGVYRFALDHHDTEDDSSGNWNRAEEYSQAQMRVFHERFLERGGDGPTIYGQTHAALARIPTSAAGDAARAPVIARLVAEDGERAYGIIRSLTGGPSRASTQLYTEDAVDDNFLDLGAQAALDERIDGWEGRVAADEAAGRATDGGVLAAIAAEREAMRARRDALADTTRYPDLPVDRAELVADYTRRIERLDAVHRRAAAAGEDAATEGMDAETYAVYHQVRQARAEAEQRLRAAERAGADALAVRSRMIASEVGGRFAGAESAIADGRAARSRGELLMPQRTADRARLSATTDLSAARAEFEEASRQFRTAEGLYCELTRGTRRPEPGGESVGRSADPAPTPPPAPARRAEAPEVAAPEPEETDEAEQARQASQRARSVVRGRDIAPHVTLQFRGLECTATVDSAARRLASGIELQLVQAQVMMILAEDVLEELDGDKLCRVDLRILAPAPDRDAFEVPAAVAGGVSYVTVDNEPGTPFEMLVRVRPPAPSPPHRGRGSG